MQLSTIGSICLLLMFGYSTAVVAQNPCGTTISFRGVPNQTLCSSLQSTERLLAYPAGGTWSGDIVYNGGFINSLFKPTGTYYAVYTALDTCNTKDSVAINVLSTQSEIWMDGRYDCQANTGVELSVFNQNNESVSLFIGDDFLISDRHSEIFEQEVNSAEDISVTIDVDTNFCSGVLEVPQTNTSRVTASVDYDCANNISFLRYTSQQPNGNAFWNRYDTQPYDLQTPFYNGDGVPYPEVGNYFLEVKYPNGCESYSSTEVEAEYPIVPSVSAGSYGLIACNLTAGDSCSLLGNVITGPVEHSWSMIDGSTFPGDSTEQRPYIPCVPARYALRTYNTASGCFSATSDTAVLLQRQPDTSMLSVQLCAGGSLSLGNQVFSDSGTYEVNFVNRFDCDSLVMLELAVSAAIVNTFDVIPDASTGTFAVNAIVQGGTAPYQFDWSDGGTGDVRTGLVAGTYVLTITDALGCVFEDTVELLQSSGVVDQIPDTFTVAPNPVQDRLEWRYTGQAQLTQVQLLNAMGQSLGVHDAQIPFVDFANLPSGIYLLEWIDERGRSTLRRIIKR